MSLSPKLDPLTKFQSKSQQAFVKADSKIHMGAKIPEEPKQWIQRAAQLIKTYYKATVMKTVLSIG